LYVGWNTVGLLGGLLISPIKAILIPSAVILLIVAVFLYRPKANDFFKKRLGD